MKIFISWSGPQSKEVAKALNYWLPKVIQSVEPFFSEEDMPKGKVWFQTIENELKEAKAGIICLTPENLEKQWILFEAGAIWKALDNYVFTYLYDLKPTEIKAPMAEFQHTIAIKEDTRKLIKCINLLQEKPKTEADMNEIFEVWWPKLDERLLAIPKTQMEEREPKKKPRPDKELLEEILTIVRDQSSYLSRLSGYYDNYDPNRNSPYIDKFEDQLRNLAAKRGVSILLYDQKSNDISRYHGELNKNDLILEKCLLDKNAADQDKQNNKRTKRDYEKNVYR